MASFEAIGAVGKSLERLLHAALREPPVPAAGTTALLMRTEDFKDCAGTQPNQRNGTTPKTMLTGDDAVTLDIPHDRNARNGNGGRGPQPTHPP